MVEKLKLSQIKTTIVDIYAMEGHCFKFLIIAILINQWFIRSLSQADDKNKK